MQARWRANDGKHPLGVLCAYHTARAVSSTVLGCCKGLCGCEDCIRCRNDVGLGLAGADGPCSEVSLAQQHL